ncbi:hypothetical protein MKK84_18810 [Methylobacterium sp. E-065]|uniref:hypothetical protein n=1 Tax=Methylobacterium sp. E-065 TaxID=2836583 RepID=UPI001FBB80E9|nr:hypothetical protein [Methylobacterium sp. E-065]MCJ2019463.1 hypothetical protein [Methylobacterium sp. E-065]
MRTWIARISACLLLAGCCLSGGPAPAQQPPAKAPPIQANTNYLQPVVIYGPDGNIVGSLGGGGGTVTQGAPGSAPWLVAPQANPPRAATAGTLGALNAAVTLPVDGMATGAVQIAGTWVGTVSWSGSIDGGATFFPINLKTLGAGGGPSVAAATANGQWQFSVAPLTHLRATMSAYTSGSAAIVISASNGAKIARVEAPLTDPLPMLTAGSTGADFSANSAAVSGTLLQSIPTTANRAYVEVQNQSANQLQLVRDDGAGNNVTTILLAGTGAGQQGGGWSSSTFKGRVRVYGPTGSQIAAYQD